MRFELSARERALLPTASDVEFYRQHGYYITKKLFTDEEIERAVAGSERYYSGERDALLPDGTRDFGWSQKDGDRLRKNDYSSLQNRDLGSLVRKPLLAAVAARLAGVSEIRLWHDQLLYKPSKRDPEVSNVGWHTDRGYWKACSSSEMLTAWVAFQDVDESMGPVYVIDGSHRFPDNTEKLNFFDPDLAKLEARFDTGGAGVLKVPMLLERGQASFHHCLTIHGSGPNVSERARRGIAVHMQPGSNRYSGMLLADGRRVGHGNDRFVRRVNGDPDYSDPAVCPTLWREQRAVAMASVP